LKVVAEELDKLNDLISSEIAEHGVKAIGFKHKDSILKAVKKENEIDLGFVGDVSGFNNEALQRSLEEGVPVICPMGTSDEGEKFNINADDVAFFMASALKAEKLVLLTNVLGVMRNPKDEHSLISTITVEGVQELIDDKIIEEGMVPKVKAAANAIRSGVGKAHIVDAKIPHALLLEIFTDQGVSTEIIK
jgi:acetylglutamate kinase